MKQPLRIGLTALAACSLLACYHSSLAGYAAQVGMKSDFPDAKHILVDEHFRSTQAEVRNAILNADEGAEVVIEIQGVPVWSSLATAFAGAAEARARSVLVNPKGEDWEAKFRTAPEPSSSWLILSFEPGGVEAQVFSLGTRSTFPATTLRFEPNSLRAWLVKNCSNRCEAVWAFADASYPARNVARSLAAFFAGWPNPTDPSLRAYPYRMQKAPRTPGRGWLPVELIQRIVLTSLPALGACQQNRIEKRLSLSVAFEILEGGAVEHAHTVAPSGNEAVEACVLDVFRRLRFPSPDGGNVEVVYPIVLIPS